MSILDILNELTSTPSTNDKVKILEREKDNKVLKRVFQAAYDKTLTYGIKKIPEYTEYVTKISLDKAIDELTVFSTRKYTGNQAIQYLSNILSRLSPASAIVLERVIQRDLRCGTSDTLAARVWPGIVPVFDVMLAHKDISGIKYPCIGQIKFDGARCHLIWDGTKASAWSRNGKEIQTLGVFDSQMQSAFGAECVTIDGELLIVRDGKIIDRKTGNGIISKANKGTITKEEADSIRMVAWDIVDVTSKIPYDVRLQTLTEAMSKALNHNMIILAETRSINSPEEAQKMFEECISHGHEGAMMKNIKQTWEPKRVKGIGKMKAVESIEVRITEIIEGTGKYAGTLGAFEYSTDDGLIKGNVGSGFSDDQRRMFFDKKYIGEIMEILYNQLITDKNTKQYSLFLPRFVDIRFDKDITSKFEEIK
ncbi:MAG: hypothetical protein GW827_06195 [Flavobacteriales bacterium]|nr:hypothetical protein [Flavobacteriales bacterium]